MGEVVLPFTRMFASILASLRSTFHGPSTPPPQTAAAAAAPQPVPLPPEGIESQGRGTAPTTHSQHSALSSMENMAVPATICVGVCALIPSQEQLYSHPLCYSPLLASLCLSVVAAGASLLWHRTEKINRKLGDWTCGSCDHLNFSRRDSCQKCGDPRMSAGDPRSDYTSFGRRGGGSSNGFGGGADVRPGDWYCACAAHNFASRATCFKCGAFKDDSSGSGRFDDDARESSRGHGGRRAGWKSGDWICHRSGCNEHNFANRVECFRCSAPREYGNYMIIYVISALGFKLCWDRDTEYCRWIKILRV
ncbi:uncharacterized protein LOC121991347 [Zingiber officinale]|uniref:uncharacterized protein LOC121991347 n=1 Tax=Zingiber officinale TaxID=94328 RepID=UPI001C4C2311|nr:uncharacterized protein LOC121991347 [Zingiber officinale]